MLNVNRARAIIDTRQAQRYVNAIADALEGRGDLADQARAANRPVSLQMLVDVATRQMQIAHRVLTTGTPENVTQPGHERTVIDMDNAQDYMDGGIIFYIAAIFMANHLGETVNYEYNTHDLLDLFENALSNATEGYAGINFGGVAPEELEEQPEEPEEQPEEPEDNLDIELAEELLQQQEEEKRKRAEEEQEKRRKENVSIPSEMTEEERSQLFSTEGDESLSEDDDNQLLNAIDELVTVFDQGRVAVLLYRLLVDISTAKLNSMILALLEEYKVYPNASPSIINNISGNTIRSAITARARAQYTEDYGTIKLLRASIFMSMLASLILLDKGHDLFKGTAIEDVALMSDQLDNYIDFSAAIIASVVFEYHGTKKFKKIKQILDKVLVDRNYEEISGLYEEVFFENVKGGFISPDQISDDLSRKYFYELLDKLGAQDRLSHRGVYLADLTAQELAYEQEENPKLQEELHEIIDEFIRGT